MTREPTEMELRVAEALNRCAEKNSPTGLPFSTDASQSQFCLALARAAIRATRSPMKEMMEAADKHSGVFASGGYLSERSDYEHPWENGWYAAIDIASPPEPDDAK